MKTEWEWVIKSILDPGIAWVAITALATIAMTAATIGLLVIGVLPLVRARRAELAERFREELLTEEAKRIFFLASHGFLTFETDATSGIAFFRIIIARENVIEQRLRQIYGEQRIVLTFEMDDTFLSPLQEVAYYIRHKAITFEEAFRLFADHVDVAVSNQAIKQYLTWIRGAKGAKDAFRDLEWLHARFIEHDKHAHPEKYKSVEAPSESQAL